MIHLKIPSPEVDGRVVAMMEILDARNKELDWYREYTAKLEQRIIDLHKALEVAMR
jgi:hypothetical protein